MGQQLELLIHSITLLKLLAKKKCLEYMYLSWVAFHNEIPFSVLDIINLGPNNNLKVRIILETNLLFLQ